MDRDRPEFIRNPRFIKLSQGEKEEEQKRKEGDEDE
jgi:hypothetical protein|tara:strand:- start:310 stop:417 length:108 start_codon:yes stop_codon:yes gene_type:complete